MSKEFSYLLEILNNYGDYQRQISVVNDFIQNNPNYIISMNDFSLIKDIVSLFIERKFRLKSTEIFLKTLTPKLCIYFNSKEIRDDEIGFIKMCTASQKNEFRELVIAIILSIIQNPKRYEIFLKEIADIDFAGNFLLFNADQLKKIRPILTSMSKSRAITPEMCLNFIKINNNKHKMLKNIIFIIPNFSNNEISTILSNFESKDAMAAVYLLNKLQDFQLQLYSFIIQNVEYISIPIFSDQLVKNAELMATFAKDQHVSFAVIEKVVVINPLLKNYFSVSSLMEIWSKDITDNDRESLLRIFYLVLKQRGEKIDYNFSKLLMEKYSKNSTFLFFKLLVSDGLFLYPSNSEFRLLLSFLKENPYDVRESHLFIDLLSTLIGSFPNKKKEDFDFFFDLYISSTDKKAEKVALNSLVSLLTLDQINFENCINYSISFFINNFTQNPIKIIHFLNKYFKKCEQMYPLMDFCNLKLHNRSLTESFTTAIFVGDKKHKFMVSLDQTVLSLRKRISYFFGSNSLIDLNSFNDSTIDGLLTQLNKNYWLLPTDNLQSIRKNGQQPTVPSICFHHMDLADSLLAFIEKKTEKKLIQKVFQILDLMPDSQKIMDMILSNDSNSFNDALFNSQQNIFFARYVISVLAHYPQSIVFQIENLLKLFNFVNDIRLKHDILSLFILIFPKIGSETNFSLIFQSFFQMMKSKLKQPFHDFLYLLANHDQQKIELDKYISELPKKRSIFINPPRIIWDIILEIIRLKKIDKFQILEKNKKSKFGAIIAENLFIALTVKDTDKLLKLLAVSGFENFDFIQMLCQSLLSNQHDFEIKEKDLNKLVSNVLETQNADIRKEILAVLLKFSQLEKYKDKIPHIFQQQFINLESDDYSFDPLNHQKSNLAIKFKRSQTVTPLNSILQNLLNLKIFLNYVYKNETRCWNFFATTEISIRGFVDTSQVFKITDDQNNDFNQKPIDVLKEIDDMSLFEFQTEFPDTSKPIFVYENKSLVENLITINGKTYKFKGLVGFSSEDNNYYSIILKNKKYIKIADNNITQLNDIPKEKRYDLVFYCEKKKVKKVKHPLVVGIEEDTLNYKKMLSAFSDNFCEFVLRFSNLSFALVYYVKFIVRLSDIKKISIFEQKLKMMRLVNDTYDTLMMLIQPIVMNFVKIDNFTVLRNFRFTIVKEILRKVPQEQALNFCKLLLDSIIVILSVNPSKLSFFLSIVRDYFSTVRLDLIDKEIARNFVQSLSGMIINCYKNHERNDIDFYCKVDLHSVFDSLRLFPNEIETPGLEELCNEQIDLICKNGKNIASLISLVYRKFGDNQQFMNNFNIKLFNIAKANESEQMYIHLFVHNLIFVKQANIDFLLDTFFNREIGSKPIDVSYLMKELDLYSNAENFKINFVQLMPSILSRFNDYAMQFSPILKKILLTAANHELKACLERFGNYKIIEEFTALEFQVYSFLSARFCSSSRLEHIAKIMETRKNDDEFCKSFQELISSINPNDVKQEYLFDILLYEINDNRVNMAIEFLKSLQNPKKFIFHPKMRDLSIYLMMHGGFEKLGSLIKPHLNPNSIELSDIPPYRLSKVARDGRSKNEMSSIISAIFNMITEKKNGVERQSKTISNLIQTITSNQTIKELDLLVKEQKMLQLYLCDPNIEENFRVQVLNLMIYSIKRDNNIFAEIDPIQFRLPNNQKVLEKYIYFFTLQSIITNSNNYKPFLVENKKLLLDSLEGIIKDKQHNSNTTIFIIKILKKIKIVEDDYEKLIEILTKVDDDSVLKLFESSVEKLKSACQTNSDTNAHKIMFIVGLSKPEMKTTFLKYLDFLGESKKLSAKYDELASIFFD